MKDKTVSIGTFPITPVESTDERAIRDHREALREALSNLLDAMANVGAPTWERALDRACLLAGRYCEPWTSMQSPHETRADAVMALAADQERIEALESALEEASGIADRHIGVGRHRAKREDRERIATLRKVGGP